MRGVCLCLLLLMACIGCCHAVPSLSMSLDALGDAPASLPLGPSPVDVPATHFFVNGQRPPVALPPRLGEHTRDLLAAAGLSAAQIDAMLGSGAAVAPSLSNAAGAPHP